MMLIMLVVVIITIAGVFVLIRLSFSYYLRELHVFDSAGDVVVDDSVCDVIPLIVDLFVVDVEVAVVGCVVVVNLF